ncbi:helix-turn-helix transcriptional regulator [Streptomyces sp. NPDC047197]|uniref:helix-turn-helix transcriptional regulator n=1 Tax=Streptomyces sp. NPDC047197 TaxID=3155477 RepID=UPI0033E73FEB
MIRNERQLAVSRKKLEELREAAEQSTGQDRQVWLRLAQEVLCEIEEFQSIRTGLTTSFELKSLDDLPSVLIKARLARNLTQSELAERLSVSEQMVQKDESGSYETARLDRLADVADALGYEFVGRFQRAGVQVFVTSPVSVVPTSPPSRNVRLGAVQPVAMNSSSPPTVTGDSEAIFIRGSQ